MPAHCRPPTTQYIRRPTQDTASASFVGSILEDSGRIRSHRGCCQSCRHSTPTQTQSPAPSPAPSEAARRTPRRHVRLAHTHSHTHTQPAVVHRRRLCKTRQRPARTTTLPPSVCQRKGRQELWTDSANRHCMSSSPHVHRTPTHRAHNRHSPARTPALARMAHAGRPRT